MNYYYTYQIPKMPDGSFVVYPPNWAGELVNPPDPKRTRTLVYNDEAGYGIAVTDDEKILTALGDFAIITEEEALKAIESLKAQYPDITTSGIHQAEKDTRKVWHGDALRLRWSKTIEENQEEVRLAIDGQLEDIFQQLGWGDYVATPTQAEPKTVYIWCDLCRHSSLYSVNIPNGTMGNVTVKTTCPDGHEVTTTLNSKGEVV